MTQRFPNLDAEMARFGVTPKDIAETLGITPSKVHDRLAGRVKIDTMQAVRIRDAHFPWLTVDYLFGKEAIRLDR